MFDMEVVILFIFSGGISDCRRLSASSRQPELRYTCVSDMFDLLLFYYLPGGTAMPPG